MQYRPFGKLNWQASALGFGAMRMPTVDNDPAHIDEEPAREMIRTAIDQGVNYVDTAFPYHREAGEAFVGRALQDGYRQRVKLATKLPIWKVEEQADFFRFLNTQLQRLDTEHIDFYLIHALDAARWEKTKRLKIMEAAERAQAEGLIGHIGFSFHDEYPVFEQILDEYKGWDFCQIQYNFMDTEYQAGRRGLREASTRGLAVIVMEPLKGGQIAAEPPQMVKPVLKQLGAERRTNGHVDLALKWVWDHPEVSLVLSGMSSMEQVQQNLASANESAARAFSTETHILFEQMREMYDSLRKVNCTGCGYCTPCPSGVNIPRILRLYNDLYMYDDQQQPRRVYNYVLDAEERADQCTECGVCEEACPQHISIIESLKAAHTLLSSSKPEEESR
ncbi:MAG TPA: aldo/keto reductase [Clostridia bacterium]|nr:aldo/keto reductase [Clostridia bacterium]